MGVPVIAAKVVASTVGKQAAKQAATQVAKQTLKKGVAAGTKRVANKVISDRAGAALKKSVSNDMLRSIGNVASRASNAKFGNMNIYDAASKLGQEALGSPNVQKAMAKGIDKALDKGLDVASKVGPAPVKAAATVAKMAKKNPVVRQAAQKAMSNLPGLKDNLRDESDDGEEGGLLDSLNPFSKKNKKNPIAGAAKMAVPAMILNAIVTVAPFLIIAAIVMSIGGCAAGLFGTVLGGDSDEGVIEQGSGAYIPSVQIEEPTGFCDEDEEAATPGNGSFTKYDISDDDVKAIAALCYGEQGSPEGVAAEASLVLNLYERNGLTGNGIREWLRGYTWFAENTRAMMDNPQVEDNIVQIVKKVIVGGMRTVPGYVDEHDYNGDISSISTGDKNNRDNYKPHETVINQSSSVGGGHWTFWGFPAGDSDPFGYTSKERREQIGDFCYKFSDLGIGGDSSNSSESSSSSDGAFTDRGDCIQKNKTTTTLGDWVYYDQCNPGWTGWDGSSFGSSCGQVAMAMVCATYGGDADKYNPNWLRGTEMKYGNQGLNQGGCVSYINSHQDEFHLKASSGHWCSDSSSWDKMKAICDAGGCVVLYQVKYSSGGMHWIVVRKIDGDNVTVANPAGGREDVFSKEAIIGSGCPNGSGGPPDAIYLEKI